MARTSTTASPKVSRPRLFGIVARERLFARIADSGSSIVWISGPPGAGKSMLAASYLQHAKRPEVWYHVDAGDKDPASFFYYMRGAAARIGDAKHRDLPLLPAEAITDLAAFARTYFRTLFSRLPSGTILVLDSFQDAEGSAFETVLHAALEEVPDEDRVIVVSLADPPAAFARLVANARIASIPPAELRLTREESDRVVLSRLQVDDATLAALHERSDGWAAGLVLMVEHLRRTPAGEPPAIAASQAAVFDYFAGEILARATPEDQRALMLSASLPRITAPLVEAVSGHRDAQRLLEYLCRRHLFVDRRDGNEPTYRYHGLFAAFLRARARQSVPASEMIEGAQRAAILLELGGAIEDAIAMYVAAGDWNAATRSIVQHARALYAQGRWRTLLESIEAMPAEVAQHEPWLAFWSGACQVWTNPARARKALENAFDAFDRAGERDGQLLAAGALTRACILSPDWTLLDPWIEALERLLAEGNVSPVASLVGYSRLLYAALVRQPQHPRQPRWAECATAALDADADPNERLLAAFSLLTYYAWTGQTQKQDEIVRYVEPTLGDPRVGPVSLTYWQWAYATHLLRSGTPAAGLAAMDRALETATDNGLAIAAVLRRHRVAHLLTLGRLDEAEAELAALANAPRLEPYHELRAWLALCRGDLDRAIDEAHEALRFATTRGRTWYRTLDLALLATICAEADSHERALEHLRAYRESTSGMTGEFAAFHADLIEAYVALRKGERARCLVLLGRALDAGSRNRYRSHWGWNPRMIGALLVEALGHGIATSYASELVRMHGIVPDVIDVAHWPWPLVVHSLGRFEVLIDGQPLRFEGKAQRKPLELLKVMLALGPNDVSIDRLIDILWPSPGDGDDRKTFDITLHRLRKLLGANGAVLVSDRHVSIDRRLVWVDAWAFDDLLEELVPASAKLPPIDRLEEAAPRILALYRGAFLAGDPDAAWQVALRNRLAGRFQRFVLRLGEHMEVCGRWAQAEELYQRAIELDALAESFYRRQMMCLQAQGRRAEALDAFRRCRQILSITLGIAPSDETVAVYRHLMTDVQSTAPRPTPALLDTSRIFDP